MAQFSNIRESLLGGGRRIVSFLLFPLGISLCGVSKEVFQIKQMLAELCSRWSCGLMTHCKAFPPAAQGCSSSGKQPSTPLESCRCIFRVVIWELFYL